MKKKYTCKFCNHESGCQYAHEQHLKTHKDQAIHCELCDTLLWDLKGLMMHVARCHKDYTKEKYWDDFVYKSKICPLSKDTNKPLNYFQYTKQHGYEIRSNFYHSTKPAKSNYICQICGVGFAEINHLAKHLTDSHPQVINEKYYLEHFWKKGDPDGKCLECGKELKFLNFKRGYQKFCYNTDCNVKYHNKHKNRHQCGENISQGQKRTQNMPNQIGFWVKKGYTEEQAKALVTERQTTNSIKKIMQRESCNLTEAKKIRKQITEKWQNTLDQKSPEEKQRILLAKIGQGFTISKAEKEIYNTLKEILPVSHSFSLQEKSKGYVYDIQYENKLIEYNGDYYHCNPKIYKEDYYNKKLHMTSKEKWQKDKDKEKFAKKKGYEMLTIWESDYKKDKEATIQKCLEFLNNE
jgi:very-short-patch-repair endonuclease